MTNPSLPLHKWPDADQSAWATAIAEGDVLDGRGPAAYWRAATRRTNIHHYGRWLAFYATVGQRDTSPAERCTQDNVKAYIAQLRNTVSAVTVAGSVIGLVETLKVIMPDHDWRWLTQIASTLKRTAKPSRDKRSRMMASEEMYRIVLQNLKQCTSEPLCGRKQLTTFRNLLMLAVITACPLRAKNFVSLRLGKTLSGGKRGWSIQVPGDEHKNGYPLLLTVPSRLAPLLEIYGAQVRPQLVAEYDPGSFWLTENGRAYTEHALYLLFIKITRRYFGRSINPHLFRDCAATSMAADSLSAAMAARSLLGHQQFETTERYYVKAEQLESCRRINAAIRSARAICDT
jgi:integrase/recombinase XerD